MKTKKYYVQPEAIVVVVGTQILLAGSGCSGCSTDTVSDVLCDYD
jgi:hypothetical protein